MDLHDGTDSNRAIPSDGRRRLGIGVRIAGSIGSVIYALMYTTLVTPENNRFMDDNLIGMIIMQGSYSQ